MIKTVFRRIFGIFLASVLLVMNTGVTGCFASEEPVILNSSTGSCGPNATYTLTEKGGVGYKTLTLTISGTGPMTDYASTDVPWKQYSSMMGKGYITNIEIEEGITAIGMYAFEACGNDKTYLRVSLPSTLTTIRNGAFKNCKGLDKVYIPGSVRYVGDNAFYGCEKLSGICFWGSSSDKPLEIGVNAFNGCNSLEFFSFPRYVSKFGATSFGNTSRAVVYYPEKGVTYDGKYYAGEKDKAGKALADAMKSDGGCDYGYKEDKTFCGIKGYIGTIEFRYDGNKSHNDVILSGEGSMPDLDSKDKYPWSNANVKKVIVYDKAENVGDHAFEGINTLESVSFQSTKLKSIGNNAFSSCSGLTSITFSKAPSEGISVGDNAFKNCTLLSDDTYLSLLTSDGKKAVTSIGEYAFSGCGMKTINFGLLNSFTIKGHAFSGCKKLEKLDLVNHFFDGEGVFENCTGLTELTLNLGSGRDVPEKSFYGCSRLNTLDIENVRSIGKNAFRGCSSLASLKIAKAETIGTYAFKDCTFLDNPEIGTVGTIKSTAFWGCTGLKTFNAGNTTTIEKNILENCEEFHIGPKTTSITPPLCLYPGSLKTVEVDPDNKNYISLDGQIILDKVDGSRGNNLIFGTGTDVIAPYGIETIVVAAFEGNTNLKTISVPNSLKTIDTSAFNGCSGLEKLYYRGTDREWGSVKIESGNDVLKKEGVVEIVSPSGRLTGTEYTWKVENGNEFSLEDSDGTTIPDFDKAADVPWIRWAPDITVVNADFITDIGNYAFYNFRRLSMKGRNPEYLSRHLLTLGGSIVRIGKYSFGNCSSITSFLGYKEDYEDGDGFSFDASGGTVEENAFNGCSKLESIDTKDQKVTFEAGAFNNCVSLKKINIGKNTTVGFPITDTPNALEELTVDEDNGEYKNSDDKTFITDKADDPTLLLLGTKACTDIPDGITTIGEGAFCGLSALDVITIPYSVTKIEKNAFNGCTGLKQINYLGSSGKWDEITIEDGNEVLSTVTKKWLQTEGDLKGNLHWKIKGTTLEITRTSGESTEIPSFENALDVPWSASATRIQKVEADFITSVGDYAFSNFTKVTNDNFVFAGVTKAGAHSFENCDSLTAVINEAGIEEIGDYAFAKCDSIENINLKNTVTIGEGAFSECAGLKTIYIPKSVTSIGSGVLKDCENLKEITVDPDSANYKGNEEKEILIGTDGTSFVVIAVIPGVSKLDLTKTTITEIGDSAFAGCSDLTEIKLPDTVTSIGNKAFEGCEKLEDLIIPEGVTSIGNRAFEGCTSLESVTIPKGVTDIGTSVFCGCTNLVELKVDDDNPKFKSEGNTIIDTETKTLVAGCNGSTGIPDDIEIIGEGAFEGCSGITAITAIPEGVKEIRDFAFTGCTGLTSMSLPSTLVLIGESAFEGCTEITDLNIPSGALVIGNRTFYDCYNMKGAIDLSNVTEIGESAFEGCSSISGLKLPALSDADKFGKAAFKNCSGLESAFFPEGLVCIPDHAFEGCLGLTELQLLQGIVTIGEGAFDGDSRLESVLMPISVKEIKANAFKDTSLKYIYYPGSKSDWGAITIGAGNEVLDLAEKQYDYVILVKPDSITVSPDSKRLKVGETLQLKADFTPSAVTESLKAVSWSSDNTEAAVVDENGLVTAKAPGDAVITVRTTSEEIPVFTAEAKIKVSIRTFTVTYKPGYEGSGVYDISEEIGDGETISLNPALFTRDGFTLSGWKDEDGASYAKDQGGIKVNKDLTFTAEWSDNGAAVKNEDIVKAESGSNIKTQVLGDTLKMSKEGKVYSISGLDTASGLQKITVNAGSKFNAQDLLSADMSRVTLSRNGVEGSAKDVKKLFKLSKKGQVTVKVDKQSAEYTLMIPLEKCTLCLKVVNIGFDKALKKKTINAAEGTGASVTVNLMEFSGKTVTENESAFLSAEWYIDGKSAITTEDGTKQSKKGLNATLSKDNRTLTVANPGELKKGSVKITAVINGKKYSTGIKAKV